MSRQWLARGMVEAPAATVFTALLEVGPIAAPTVNPTL